MNQTFLNTIIQRRLSELTPLIRAQEQDVEKLRADEIRATAALRARHADLTKAQETLAGLRAEARELSQAIATNDPAPQSAQATSTGLPAGYQYVQLPAGTPRDPNEVTNAVEAFPTPVPAAAPVKTLSQQVLEFLCNQTAPITVSDLISQFSSSGVGLLGQVLNRLQSQGLVSKNLDNTYRALVEITDISGYSALNPTDPTPVSVPEPAVTATLLPVVATVKYPAGYPAGSRRKMRTVLDHLHDQDRNGANLVFTLDDVIQWMLAQNLGSKTGDSRGLVSQLLGTLVDNKYLLREGKGVFRVVRA